MSKRYSGIDLIFLLVFAVTQVVTSVILVFGSITGHNFYGDHYTPFERQVFYVLAIVLVYVTGRWIEDDKRS